MEPTKNSTQELTELETAKVSLAALLILKYTLHWTLVTQLMRN